MRGKSEFSFWIPSWTPLTLEGDLTIPYSSRTRITLAWVLLSTQCECRSRIQPLASVKFASTRPWDYAVTWSFWNFQSGLNKVHGFSSMPKWIYSVLYRYVSCWVLPCSLFLCFVVAVLLFFCCFFCLFVFFFCCCCCFCFFVVVFFCCCCFFSPV